MWQLAPVMMHNGMIWQAYDAFHSLIKLLNLEKQKQSTFRRHKEIDKFDCFQNKEIDLYLHQELMPYSHKHWHNVLYNGYISICLVYSNSIYGKYTQLRLSGSIPHDLLYSSPSVMLMFIKVFQMPVAWP